MRIWVIGAGGLLGSALIRAIDGGRRPGDTSFTAPGLSWGEPDLLREQLVAQAARFTREATGEPWAVIWAAGQASTASTDAEAHRELEALQALIDALLEHHPHGPGLFFLTSSAGGVYAGSHGAPFTSATEPRALSAYGRLKLAQEAVAAERLGGIVTVVIGRFSNLYGPGQDLGKLQGLVSRLALSAITREPVTMFVSLDTVRDYLYVDDAAAIALHHIDTALGAQAGVRSVIIASGQPTPLGRVIHTVEDVARARIPVAHGTHASSGFQAKDLRLQPSGGAAVAALVATTLPAGVRRVLDDLAARHRAATGLTPVPY